MGSELFFPTACQIEVERLQMGPPGLTIGAVCSSPVGFCPSCGRRSSQTRGTYTRTLHDLTLLGRRTDLKVTVPRFACGNVDCARRTFAAPLAGLTQPHARRTDRQIASLQAIGFASGGEAGSRLASHLGLNASPDTLLRMIRRAPPPPARAPRVLGVDDWAWRRGNHYGTILCDLERHCPVDLLSDRSAEGLADWLKRHPTVEIISRDRASCYAQGASAGAPEAVQVADRWHLLHNLHEALIRVLDRHHREVRKAAKETAGVQAQPTPPATEALAAASSEALDREREDPQSSRSRRMARYQQIVALHDQGVSLRSIARRLGMHRSTVRRFLAAGQFPERATRQYSSRLDLFTDYVRGRVEAGCFNAAQIARELREQGFDREYSMVRRRIARWRKSGRAPIPAGARLTTEPASYLAPSSNRVAWWLTQKDEDLEPGEEMLVDALQQGCPEVRMARGLVHEIVDLLSTHRSNGLEDWISRAHAQDAPKELTRFADGLRLDYAAVKAAFELEWSNGQVEGQVNRLKLIKRTMYGRAGFDLLRQRVLHTG